MDTYHIALFIHIVALVVAASATAVTELAAERRARARTIGDALEWHGVMMSAAKAFPICLVLFVLTGGYMPSVAQTAVWSSGFVVAGLVGVLLLLASGTFLRIKGKALKQVLDNIAKNGADHPAPKLAPPAAAAILPPVNTAIALAVVFDMVVKPADVSVALGVILLGIVAGALLGLRRKPAPAMSEATAA